MFVVRVLFHVAKLRTMNNVWVRLELDSSTCLYHGISDPYLFRDLTLQKESAVTINMLHGKAPLCQFSTVLSSL